MNHRAAACVVVLLLSAVAFAQDVEKLTAADIDVYLKVETARAAADARKMFTRDPAERDKLKTAREDAIKAAGMTEERYDAVSGLISTIAQALADVDRGGDDAAAARETLRDLDKPSVELVKARLKEINDDSGREERARKQAKEARDAEVRGPAPDPAKLAGTWVFDVDATINAMGLAGDPEIAKKLRDDLTKSSAGNSYTFGPGEAIQSTAQLPDGKTRTDKGTYRLDGNTLYIKAEGSRREQKMTVGMKGDALVFTMFGVPTYFKKQ